MRPKRSSFTVGSVMPRTWYPPASPRRPAGAAFAWRFALCAGAMFGIYAFPFELFGAKQDWMEGYLRSYARVAALALSAVEPGVVAAGNVIQGRYALQIVRNCDAADVNILLTSATLAYPGPWRVKLPLLAGGLLLLGAANVGRICSLYFVGVYAPHWFKLAHEEAWPLLLVVLTLAIFLLSLGRLSRTAPQ